MKIKYLFLITILIVTTFINVRCKKVGEQCTRTKVKGVITDYDSGAPVANAIISIIEENTTQTPFSHDTITSCQTNSNGEYSIKFHAQAEDVYIYYIHINKEPEGYNDDVSFELKKRHLNKLNYAVKGKSYLQIRIKNITPYDENDYISLAGWPNFNGSFKGYGTAIDTSVIFAAKGSTYIQLGWTVIKNNIQQNFLDSIFCHSLATTEYTINY